MRGPDDARDDDRSELDLRALGLGAASWLGALGALGPVRWWTAAVLLAGSLLVLRRRRTGRGWLTGAAWVLAGSAAFGSAVLHVEAVTTTPLVQLAEQHAAVTAVVELHTDPVRSQGRFSTGFAADGDVTEVISRGRRIRLHALVYVQLPASAGRVQRGSVLRVTGLLRPAFRADQAAVLTAGQVHEVSGPGILTTAANRLRRAVRDAVADRSTGARALVPALVDGQDGALAPEIVEDFRTSGLTHLLAVSGTNLTLIVGCLLVLARWAGLRARALVGVGVLGVGGFLLLAGTEPSVLRAAAMGTIALLGLGSGGRRLGVRALGGGVLVLVVLDPWLALSAGFALSVVATAGILLLAPGWRDALQRWLPRWAAELLAVPLAAQIACTPLIAGISGQVSLVAVLANLLAAPFVGPATVLGLTGGVAALFWARLGGLVAFPAAWAADLLIGIARHAAGLPVPAVAWSTSAISLLGLLVLCAGTAAGMRHVLERRWASLLAAGLMVLGILVPLPTPGWPPSGWVLVACSIGQGDGLVLRVGAHSAVVVDAGPEPRAMDRCLRRLSVRVVPVVVLTHFHADHVDGLPGVLDGRKVGEIVVSPLDEPGEGSAAVRREARAAGVPVRVVVPGERTTVGPLSWQVLAPLRTTYPDSDSPPNDASVVLLVEVHGIRILMMGDEERPSQADLARTYPDLHADVLKVAHHGSSKQDEQLVRSLGARLAVTSVGLGNDYGHPAGSTLGLLERAGMQVRRTDRDGDVAVVVSDSGQLSTVVLGNRG